MSLTSCGPNYNYEPGQIPGLGSSDGELTGAMFQLPDGVILIDDITGKGDPDGYWDFSETRSYQFTDKNDSVITRQISPKLYRDETQINYRGSGNGYVDLLVPMHNSNNYPVTVTFPAALIAKNYAGNCQNGVLLKKVIVEIPANSDYYLNLSFYCGNLTKSTASDNDIYSFSVVSDAEALIELCDLLKNKKINIEEFDPTKYEDQSTFESQVGMLQLIVWSITEWNGLNRIYTMYINGLPESN